MTRKPFWLLTIMMAALLLLIMLKRMVTDMEQEPDLVVLQDASITQREGKRNIVLIVVDDLRKEIVEGTLMPNFDELRRDAAEFEYAYSQYPLCNPSRASFLSGRRPDETKIFDLDSRIDQKMVHGAPTLPWFLKMNGYYTMCGGKVFHGDTEPSAFDRVFAPSVVNPFAKSHNKCTRRFYEKGSTNRFFFEGVSYLPDAMCMLKDEKGHTDFENVRLAAAELERAKRIVDERNHLKGFFLAIGLISTHLPWMTKRQYWNLHDIERSMKTSDFDISQDKREQLRGSGEFPFVYEQGKVRGKIFNSKTINTMERRAFRLGYRAASTQMDAALGILLDTLVQLNLTQTTAVIFLADHGFSLGEHGHYGKRALDDQSTRVPLVIRCSFPECRKGRYRHAVELVDLYRTVASLALLSNQVSEKIDGKNILVNTGNDSSVATSQVLRCKSKICPTDIRPWNETIQYFGYVSKTRGTHPHEESRWYRAKGLGTNESIVLHQKIKIH